MRRAVVATATLIFLLLSTAESASDPRQAPLRVEQKDGSVRVLNTQKIIIDQSQGMCLVKQGGTKAELGMCTSVPGLLSRDPSPQLGGNLDLNGYSVLTGTSTISPSEMDVLESSTSAVTWGDGSHMGITWIWDVDDFGAGDPMCGISAAGIQFNKDLVLTDPGKGVVFEGEAADAYETTLKAKGPTGADKTVYLPDAPDGAVLLSRVEDDTVPQLGGDLGMNGKSITTGTATISPTEMSALETGKFQFSALKCTGVSGDLCEVAGAPNTVNGIANKGWVETQLEAEPQENRLYVKNDTGSDWYCTGDAAFEGTACTADSDCGAGTCSLTCGSVRKPCKTLKQALRNVTFTGWTCGLAGSECACTGTGGFCDWWGTAGVCSNDGTRFCRNDDDCTSPGTCTKNNKTCKGGSNGGASCSTSAACYVCTGGTNDGTQCTADSDCTGGGTCDKASVCTDRSMVCVNSSNKGQPCVKDSDCGILGQCRFTPLRCLNGTASGDQCGDPVCDTAQVTSTASYCLPSPTHNIIVYNGTFQDHFDLRRLCENGTAPCSRVHVDAVNGRGTAGISDYAKQPFCDGSVYASCTSDSDCPGNWNKCYDSTTGAPCSGGSCKCSSCQVNDDCPGADNLCYGAKCAGGTNDGLGCYNDADCPGGFCFDSIVNATDTWSFEFHHFGVTQAAGSFGTGDRGTSGERRLYNFFLRQKAYWAKCDSGFICRNDDDCKIIDSSYTCGGGNNWVYARTAGTVFSGGNAGSSGPKDTGIRSEYCSTCGFDDNWFWDFDNTSSGGCGLYEAIGETSGDMGAENDLFQGSMTGICVDRVGTNGLSLNVLLQNNLFYTSRAQGCSGGAFDGDPCTDDSDCPGVCTGSGANPYDYQSRWFCYQDADCPQTCEGGANDGTTCTASSDCTGGGTCTAQTCTATSPGTCIVEQNAAISLAPGSQMGAHLFRNLYKPTEQQVCWGGARDKKPCFGGYDNEVCTDSAGCYSSQFPFGGGDYKADQGQIRWPKLCHGGIDDKAPCETSADCRPTCVGGTNDGYACADTAKSTDCPGGGTCTSYYCYRFCGNDEKECGCPGTCSVTSSIQCYHTNDCPSGETCSSVGKCDLNQDALWPAFFDVRADVTGTGTEDYRSLLEAFNPGRVKWDSNNRVLGLELWGGPSVIDLNQGYCTASTTVDETYDAAKKAGEPCTQDSDCASGAVCRSGFQNQLPKKHGGTGADLSGLDGFLKLSSTGSSTAEKVTLTDSTEVEGTLPVSSGGTGLTTCANRSVLGTNSTDTISCITAGSSNVVLGRSGTGNPISWLAASSNTVLAKKGTAALSFQALQDAFWSNTAGDELGAAHGGTGDDTSGTTGLPVIISGDWQYPALGADGSLLAGAGTGSQPSFKTPWMWTGWIGASHTASFCFTDNGSATLCAFGNNLFTHFPVAVTKCSGIVSIKTPPGAGITWDFKLRSGVPTTSQDCKSTTMTNSGILCSITGGTQKSCTFTAATVSISAMSCVQGYLVASGGTPTAPDDIGFGIYCW